MCKKTKIIVLFDEQGTPTFNRDTSTFIGVSLLYIKKSERHILDSCSDAFGLSKKSPLKNDKVSKSRAIKMAKSLGALPVWMLVLTLDMTDERLRSSAEQHIRFSSQIRAQVRGISRESKVAHLLHTSLLVDCFMILITNYLKTQSNSNLAFQLFMDNWTIPEVDRSIILKYQSESLEDKINSGCAELGLDISTHVRPIQLLSEDSKRKRFRKRLIDGCATVVSRSFLNERAPKYSSEPLEILENELEDRFQIGDRTDFEIEHMENIERA